MKINTTVLCFIGGFIGMAIADCIAKKTFRKDEKTTQEIVDESLKDLNLGLVDRDVFDELRKNSNVFRKLCIFCRASFFRENNMLYSERRIIFMNLTFNERLACSLLTKLKHDGQNFLDCRFNDLLVKFVELTLNVDPIELITKVVKYHDNTTA